MKSARQVVLVALPGMQLLDLVGPLEIFDAATRWMQLVGDPRPGYQVVVVGPPAGSVADPVEAANPAAATVTTAAGLPIVTQPLTSVRGTIDTLLVGGAIDFVERRFDPELCRWFTAKARRARRVASVCAGAFLLGQLGLLDGRRATTHWIAVDKLSEQFPSVQVLDDAIYVKDGKIYTSAGVTAGMDLALALVEEDLGHEVAVAVARLLVMFLHRPGGQSQFSAALAKPAAEDDGIRRVQAQVVEHPQADHRVPSMAKRAGMSPRHFARVFAEQTGETPARFVLRVRVERARGMLEKGELGVDAIAEACGFGAAETMRRGFLRELGVSPTAYRARFRQVA